MQLLCQHSTLFVLLGNDKHVCSVHSDYSAIPAEQLISSFKTPTFGLIHWIFYNIVAVSKTALQDFHLIIITGLPRITNINTVLSCTAFIITLLPLPYQNHILNPNLVPLGRSSCSPPYRNHWQRDFDPESKTLYEISITFAYYTNDGLKSSKLAKILQNL